MPYELAVWEGDRPADDVAAAAQCELLASRYIETNEPAEPTARIVAFVAALLERHPDIDTDAGAGSPWSVGPLITQASGPLVYVPMVWSRCDEISAWVVQVAEDHGLNCYDPLTDQLRTPWGRPWRFELTAAQGHPVRDPDPERVRKVLTRVGVDNLFAVLTRSDDWYFQVGYGEWAGTRPGWYVLERREGTPDRHYRAEVTSIQDVIRAFTGFLRDDPAIPHWFTWRSYVP
jgi:hypothetical protein